MPNSDAVAHVERARRHVRDVRRLHTQDPRSQQLIDEELLHAETALREALEVLRSGHDDAAPAGADAASPIT